MVRITIDGKIAQFSTKLSVDLNKWDLKYGRVIGRVVKEYSSDPVFTVQK